MASGGCGGGCLPWAWGRGRRPVRLRADHPPDKSPSSRHISPRTVQVGYAVSIDEVPSKERPRVGSWASPAPYSPTPWGTWARQAQESPFETPCCVQFGLSVEEQLPSSIGRSASGGPPSSAGSTEEAAARRRRLREVGLEARRLESAENTPLLPSTSSGGSGDFRLEQLFASPGNLPPGPSKAERERKLHQLIDKTITNLPPGSTTERMNPVPRRLLTARGPEGQRLRRAVMSGSIIVFFTAGYEGKRFVYERAHALGVRSVIIDAPDSWSRGLVDEGIIAKFIPVNMSQSSEIVYDQALEAIRGIETDPSLGAADGVATVVELSVPLAARLAEALSLPGPMPEAVDRARDKHATRAAMAAAGLPTPPNCAIHGEADLDRAAREVGFPAVLKPVSGAASLGVKKVETESVLRSTYLELQREVSSLIVSSGALVKDDGQSAGVKADSVVGTTFMLERYLDGDEVDVDVVMSEGEWQYAAVSDNGPTLEPYFNETWAVCPSLLPRQQQVELKDLAISSIKALGFLDGVFHVECKYTSSGPHLIEVNARMGGGPVYTQNLKTWNVCLVEETLFCAVGIPARPDVPRQPVVCIANSDVNALKSGRLVDTSFLEPLKEREGVVSFSPHVSAGDHVVGPADGLPTWLVEIVVSRPTPREALDFLLSLEAEVQARVRLA